MNAPALDLVVSAHDLNRHPFYRAWRAGTLPRAALATYAAEYAPFIAAVELGWRTLGDHAHAAEEREHARLWERFRDALGPSEVPRCKETAALADVARASFADPVAAIGALYAFEAQQPSTAQSKLEGLRAHYALPEEAHAYFRDHAEDYGEREALRARLADLGDDAAAHDRAQKACEAMCVAMWSALDGVLAASAPHLACS
jgi:pyrroloquinoline-quinone synthase